MPSNVPLARAPKGARFDVKGMVWLAASVMATTALVSGVAGRPAHLADLVAAMDGAPRSLEGRLTGGFAHARLATPTRAATPPSPPWRVLAAAARAQEASDRDPSAANLHALGVAALNVANYDVAVQALEDAAVVDDAGARIQSDLAAAYLARASQPAHAIDLPRAVEAASRARRLDGRLLEARFNHAMALERLSLRAEAAKAWDGYLAIARGDAGWAEEARRRREAIDVPPVLPHVSPAAEAQAILREWAVGTARDPDGVLLPDLSRHGTFYTAIAQSVARARGDARTVLARHVLDVLDAEAALAQPNYSAAERLAASVQAQVTNPESPLFLWAERIRLSTGFNTGRGIDVRQRAERLVESATRLDFKGLEADAWHRIGALDYVAGRYDRAIDGYGRALTLRQSLGDPRGEGSSRLALGDALHRLGRDPEAWIQYRSNLDGPAASSPVLRHSQLSSATMAGLDAGFLAAALAFGREIEHHANQIGHAGFLAEALYLQARASIRAGDSASASAAVARSRSALDALDDMSIRDRYLADITQVEAEIAAMTSPVEAVRVAAESQQRFRVLNTHQRLVSLAVLEARAYRALGRVAEARAALHEGDALVEAQQRQIGRDDYLPSFLDASWDVFSELVDLEAASNQPSAALLWLDRGFDVRRRWNSGVSAVPLADVSRDGPLVAYLARPDALWIWVVADGRAQVRRVPVTRSALQRGVSRLTHLLTLDDAPAALDDAAAALARDIWWPIVELLEAGGEVAPRMALLIDPTLQRVPFALLPWSPGSTDRIVDRTATVLCPSVLACTARRDARNAGAGRVAALHAGQGGAGLAVLPAARGEAERVGRHHAMSTVASATAPAFAEALATADTLHFAGHALPDERYPGRSHLLLADETNAAVPVPLGRLLPGQVRARLVVLSACSTSRAEARRGEGGTGVAGEFLRAGVRDVVAAQWDVDDDVTSEMMDHLHEALATGASPWDAVRLAQQRVRATAGRHPRDWAGYIAFTATSSALPNTPAAASAAASPQRSHP